MLNKITYYCFWLKWFILGGEIYLLGTEGIGSGDFSGIGLLTVNEEIDFSDARSIFVDGSVFYIGMNNQVF